jgi:hypothetical protein
MAAANARLIAAAPELLRVAQAMWTRLDLQAREQGAAAVLADAALRADLGAAISQALNG